MGHGQNAKNAAGDAISILKQIAMDVFELHTIANILKMKVMFDLFVTEDISDLRVSAMMTRVLLES